MSMLESYRLNMLTIVEWTIYLVLGTLCGYLLFKLTQIAWIIPKAIFGKRQKDLASQGVISQGGGAIHNSNFLPVGGPGFGTGLNGCFQNHMYCNCGNCIDCINCIDTVCPENHFNGFNHCGHNLHGWNYNCDLDGDGIPDYLDDD